MNTLSRDYKPTPASFRARGEGTHGKGRHKPKKIGERISYATPSGRASGTVVEAHREYYLVKKGNNIVKVNRNSILYAMGTFLGRASQLKDNAKKAYEFGKKKESERLEKFKKQYGKKPKRAIRKKRNQ